MPWTWMPTIQVSTESHTIWHRGGSKNTFGGTRVYTDGALKQLQWWKDANRAGWGVAQVLEDGTLEYGCYGPLPGPVQTVPRAKLYGICEALARSLGPIRIHTDHKPIVDGLFRGKGVGHCLCFGK